MSRIEHKYKKEATLARMVLTWITHAKRPLTLPELQHALSVEDGDTYFDEDKIPDEYSIVSVCEGLISIDKESTIIQMVHYTAKEYFYRMKGKWFPDADRYITICCVTYLLFDSFDTGFCSTDAEFEARLRMNVLYSYAARNWGRHAREASEQPEKLILNFLESDAKVSSSSQAMMTVRGGHHYSQEAPRMSGIHVAAYYGLRESIFVLLKNGNDTNLRDTWNRTPLMWATENGHESVIQLLVEKGAEIDLEDSRGWTPLTLAVTNGYISVVKLLLKNGAFTEARVKNVDTALLKAAEQGHEVIVKILLEKGAYIEAWDKNEERALLKAAEQGHEVIVKILLEKGANIEAGKYGETALLKAAKQGHEAVIKILLEKGAYIEARDIYGEKALLKAAKQGHEAVVQILLEKGADIEAGDECGETALVKAAEQGHEVVVQLLREAGADIEAKNKNGDTVLEESPDSTN